ncbi:Isochorismatase-like protein [Microdochium trichocladiopsis]|uniref:Isochorismatase-like protein n=1 Tax=Microdochium trichocladiopsis TaxID=1682393 RepID=A0A9P8XXY5_9PEZI|nr:Isochorismatase-like protein [Microdochium trichocladiopsis]KAH7025680.1 Isochorismatase-like protein [Microdochium trichocladiopsis]
MAPALDTSKYPEYAAECGDPSRTMKLGAGTRPAVLLMDVCDAYLSHRSPLHIPDSERAAAAISTILSVARSSSGVSDNEKGHLSDQEALIVPVIYAQTVFKSATLRDAGLQALKNPQLSKFFCVANPDHLTGLTSIASPEDQLHPRPTDLRLQKKYPSPFFGTNLSTQLAALGIDTLLIAGFTTSVNVRCAALDAMQSGFRPLVVADACADWGRETHWANLLDMGAKYGDVVSTQEAVDIIKQATTAR